MNVSNYTNKVYAKYYIERESNYIFVEWALELMRREIESENLYILAGLNSKSGEEIDWYFKQALEDLKLELINNEFEIQNLYTRSLYEQLKKSELTPREVIQKMWHLCSESKYHKRFSEFHNINQDIESIEYGEGSVYDKTLNFINFEQKLKSAFEKFNAK